VLIYSEIKVLIYSEIKVLLAGKPSEKG
jgi:hypothetical protein